MIRIWLAYHVQVIGEAASKVSKDLKTKYAEVPWRAMAAMRHILVHDYFETDFEEVWIVVDRDLPELRRKIEELSKALD